ncbi:hypothetical protein [uncultured Anaerococcus sp.]|uniref:hypothetical protein n=1 Tax=uncultured Anaerococcus sp. TaxID=293428 RepID=UPI0025E706EF|nr:hypothetical protein [uncultured Anaerococcus sp.]
MNYNIKFEDKIKVFISSKCGDEKYDTIRNELKLLLEETGFISAYVFEGTMASSMTARDSYLNKLNDSDVCLFLISNEEDVPEGVVTEYRRSLILSKKSIFIFCNDDNKKITRLQQEIRDNNGPKYKTINEFDKLKETVYESLIIEIIEIYANYCRGHLVSTNFYDINNNGIDNFNDNDFESADEIDKSLYSSINVTKNKLCELIGLESDIPEDRTNKFDILSSQFLDVLFYNDSIYRFDKPHLLFEIGKNQSEKYSEVTESRWNAIVNYFKGDIDKAIIDMNKAYDIAKNNKLPNWYLQDITIDLRNLRNFDNEINNKIVISNEEQKKILSNKKPLYYPLNDRNEKNLYKEIIKETINEASKSPSTVRYGNNISKYIMYISNYYITAIYYGSLSHLISIIDMMKLMVYQLCDEYDDWNFRKFLIKTTLISERPKEIKKVYNLFNDIYGKMDSTTAREIYKSIENYPIVHRRNIRKFLCFQYLGCYFNDDFFTEVWEELHAYILTWISDKNRVINLGYYFFDAIEYNIKRICGEEIVNIIILFIDNDLSRFYRNIVSLLGDVDIQSINIKTIVKLLDKIIKIINLDGISINYDNLAELFSNINKCFSDNIKINTKVDLIVNEYFPEITKMIYKVLETNNQDVILEFINKNIQIIHERNKSQGVDGKYSMSGYDPYTNIRNIIDVKKIEIENDIKYEIIDACVETLLAENQLIYEKCGALDLIISILNNSEEYKENKNIKYMLENEETILNVRDSNFIGMQSQFTLNFKFSILKLVLDKLEIDDLILLLATYTDVDDFDKIESLRTIFNICKYGYISNAKDDIKAAILQFVLQKSYDSNLSVRYRSVEAMLYMLRVYNKKSIISRINKMMNFDSAHIKFLILKNLESIKSIDVEAYEFIKSKAESDDHFIIRNYKNYL